MRIRIVSLLVLSLLIAGEVNLWGGLRFTEADRRVFDSYRQKIKRIKIGASMEDARLQIGFPYLRQVTEPYKGHAVEVWSYPTDEFTLGQVAFIDGKLAKVLHTAAAGAIFVRGGSGLSPEDFTNVRRFDAITYGMKATDVLALLGEPKELYDERHPIPESAVRQLQPNLSPEDVAGFAKFMRESDIAIWAYRVADVAATITFKDRVVMSVTEIVMPSEEQARLLRAQ